MCAHENAIFYYCDLAVANRLLTAERDKSNQRCADLQERLRACEQQLAATQETQQTTSKTLEDADLGGAVIAYSTAPVPLGHLVALHQRWRQFHEHGFGADNDDCYVHEELVAAACCFAKPELMPSLWPWPGTRHVPRKAKYPTEFEDRLSDLAKAAAFLMAEIDRLLRAHHQGGGRVAELEPVSEALKTGGGCG